MEGDASCVIRGEVIGAGAVPLAVEDVGSAPKRFCTYRSYSRSLCFKADFELPSKVEYLFFIFFVLWLLLR